MQGRRQERRGLLYDLAVLPCLPEFSNTRMCDLGTGEVQLLEASQLLEMHKTFGGYHFDNCGLGRPLPRNTEGVSVYWLVLVTGIGIVALPAGLSW